MGLYCFLFHTLGTAVRWWQHLLSISGPLHGPLCLQRLLSPASPRLLEIRSLPSDVKASF